MANPINLTHYNSEINLIQPYLVPDCSDKCIIIFPGGGYDHLSYDKEGANIAKYFNQQGYSAAVFLYQLTPISFNKSQIDLARWLNKNQFKKVGFIGFSAGAHMAMVCSQYYDANWLAMCYPVVSLIKEYQHMGSSTNLMKYYSKQEISKYSIEHLDLNKFPPIFMWHTANDSTVSVLHSLLLAEKLTSHHHTYEYHIFPSGRHGLALTNESSHVQQWIHSFQNWLKYINY